jgi:hypothetical protein
MLFQTIDGITDLLMVYGFRYWITPAVVMTDHKKAG